MTTATALSLRPRQTIHRARRRRSQNSKSEILNSKRVNSNGEEYHLETEEETL